MEKKIQNNSVKHWLVLLVCCGLVASSVGCMANAVGVYFTPVSTSLGVLRGTFVLQTTFMSLASSATALFVPKLYRKFNFKAVLFISVLAAAVSTFLLGFSREMWQFYALNVVRGVSSCMFSFIPVTMIINYWFHKKTGLATSLVLSFSGIAGAVFSPVFSSLISAVGWEKTYMLNGIFVLVLCMPAVIFPFTMDPRSCGMMPYGDDGAIKQQDKKEKRAFNFRQATVIFFIVFAIAQTAIISLSQHFPGFAESIGYSASVGAAMVSAIMVGNITSKLIIGIVSDKLGPVKAVIIMQAVVFTAVVVILTAPSSVVMLAGGFLFGAAYSIGSVGIPLLTKMYFGLENYSSVYPAVTFATGLASAFISTLVGYIYDFTGSYYPSIAGAMVLDAVGICFVLIITRKLKSNASVRSVPPSGGDKAIAESPEKEPALSGKGR